MMCHVPLSNFSHFTICISRIPFHFNGISHSCLSISRYIVSRCTFMAYHYTRFCVSPYCVPRVRYMHMRPCVLSCFHFSIYHSSFFSLSHFISQHVIYHLSEVHLSYVVYRMSSSYHPFMKCHIRHTMFHVSKCAMSIYGLSCITMSVLFHLFCFYNIPLSSCRNCRFHVSWNTYQLYIIN